MADMTREAFEQAMRGAVAASGLEALQAGYMHQRLHDHRLDGSAGWWHFQAGQLRSTASRPVAVTGIKDLVVGPGGNTAADNTAELLVTLSHIGDAVCNHYIATGYGTAATKTATADSPSEEVKLSKESYRDLATNQNVFVELPNKMAAGPVGRLRREVVQNNYVESLPDVTRIPLASKVGARREVGLGGFGEEKLTISVSGDGAVSAATTITAVQHNTRVLIYALLAVMSRQITATAFGGGSAGVVPMPGEKKHIRVQLCAAKAERLLWALTHAASAFGGDVASYAAMVNNVLYEFLRESEKLTMHPSDIVDLICDTRQSLFRVGAGETASHSSGASSAHSATPTTDAAPGGARHGVCSSWLANGACRAYNDGTCTLDHPANLCAVGRGNGRRGATQNQPAWNPAWNQQWNQSWAQMMNNQWGQNNNNNWTGWEAPKAKKQKTATKGKGGKGKGGKGKGGKGGKGQWW